MHNFPCDHYYAVETCYPFNQYVLLPTFYKDLFIQIVMCIHHIDGIIASGKDQLIRAINIHKTKWAGLLTQLQTRDKTDMEGKQQIVIGLKNIFNRWEELLTSLSEDQITQPMSPSKWSVKDVVAHLWAWQQASVARMEAALQERAPNYPEWWKIHGPDPEENVDRTNAWLYEASLEKTWQKVHEDWKTQFLHYLELLKQIPEEDLLALGRYTWMGNYALSASSMGSLEHHEEHYESLRSWLEHLGIFKTGG